MAGLFGIGVALILGIGMRLATVSAVVMLFLMYLASFPMTTNPIIDDHVIDALAITAVGLLGAGDVYGLGRRWKALPIVQRNPLADLTRCSNGGPSGERSRRGRRRAQP